MPFHDHQTTKIKTKATGPENIFNIHLTLQYPKHHNTPKHQQILLPTQQNPHFMEEWQNNYTLLKPNQNPTEASSYRPITLLCTPSKVTKINTNQNPYIPLSHTHDPTTTQHSFSQTLPNKLLMASTQYDQHNEQY